VSGLTGGDTVAVIGGGVSGLTAAYRLRNELGPATRIVICEATARPGGKLRTDSLAGHPFDVGAEAFLARRPEAVALAGEVGLGQELVHPTRARAVVHAGGRTLPLPPRTLMGIPADPETVSGLLSPDGLRAVAAESESPPVSLPDGDVSLGGLLRRRFGDELVDRLVDPLLGGVYAGGADGLGLRATLPALAAALESGAPSITAAVAEQLPSAPGTAPVFATLPCGLGVLTDRLLERSGAELRSGVPVRALRRHGTGWRLTFGAAAAGHEPADAVLDAAAVVLAVPAPAAARLLSDVLPEAASAFAGIEHASMAVVALAMPPGTVLPASSGLLIGAGERRRDGAAFTAKAFTFSARKWAHHGRDGEPPLIRGSVGRFGDVSTLRVTDDELLRRVRADLAELTGVRADPVDTLVTRWGGGLPQYGVGHLERVARIEAAVADQPTLAIAGAALHGVGIPACIATADAAARRLAGTLSADSAS
jgi:oxygen-dependent protoporphyrinogen oxidase